MSTPSSPLEAFQSAARTVFGRMACFCISCSLGGAIGYLLDYSRQTETGPFCMGFLFTASVVPLALVSFLGSYGLIVFPVCLLFAFAFIRLELPLRWLAVPFVLVVWQAWILEVASW